MDTSVQSHCSGPNRKRRWLLTRGAAFFASGIAPAIVPSTGGATQQTLRILRWKHFVPGFDRWFNEELVPRWAQENNVRIEVDNVGLGELNKLASAEAGTGRGHDLVLHLAPPALFEDHVIDHQELHQECQHRYGPAIDFTSLGTRNARTGKFYGLCESYAPTVLSYRRDWWGESGILPTHWDNVRKGGRIIKLQHDKPVGLSLAPEHNGEHTLRSLLYAFGGSVQNEAGEPALKSAQTLEAIKFCRALYREAMSPEVLEWNPASNNHYLLSQEGSLTVDTLSIPRAAEGKSLPVDANLELALLPEGPAGRVGLNFGQYTYSIWSFSRNIELAKKFLIDYIGYSGAALQASGFQNMPSFPGAVPELDNKLNQDRQRPRRYRILSEVRSTMSNLGYPGNSNAATIEIQNSGILSKMFAEAATGRSSPEDAMSSASKAIEPVFRKWREAGKV